jgi:hypothetical protein
LQRGRILIARRLSLVVDTPAVLARAALHVSRMVIVIDLYHNSDLLCKRLSILRLHFATEMQLVRVAYPIAILTCISFEYACKCPQLGHFSDTCFICASQPTVPESNCQAPYQGTLIARVVSFRLSFPFLPQGRRKCLWV